MSTPTTLEVLHLAHEALKLEPSFHLPWNKTQAIVRAQAKVELAREIARLEGAELQPAERADLVPLPSRVELAAQVASGVMGTLAGAEPSRVARHSLELADEILRQAHGVER